MKHQPWKWFMELTNKLKYFLRTAHYIAVQCRPISDYVILSKLEKAKGVAIGDSYLNRKLTTMFIDLIAQVEWQKLYNDINRFLFHIWWFYRQLLNRAGNVICAICDQWRDQWQIYCYTACWYKGLLVDIFWNETAFECIGLDSETLINKVVGVGFDGASVHFGHKTAL